jgi:hypothetical protein
MNKPTPKKGQKWEKYIRYSFAADTVRIRLAEEPRGGRVQVETLLSVSPERWGRRRSLLVSALSNTPKGYRLVKDAP